VSDRVGRRSDGADDRLDRALIAVASGAVFTLLAYAAQRVVERVFFPEPNPAVLIWSERSTFLWRALFSLYFGGFGGFAGYLLATRSSGASLRWLPWLICAGLVVLLLQVVLAP
jgi:hypothetical protein